MKRSPRSVVIIRSEPAVGDSRAGIGPRPLDRLAVEEAHVIVGHGGMMPGTARLLAYRSWLASSMMRWMMVTVGLDFVDVVDAGAGPDHTPPKVVGLHGSAVGGALRGEHVGSAQLLVLVSPPADGLVHEAATGVGRWPIGAAEDVEGPVSSRVGRGALDEELLRGRRVEGLVAGVEHGSERRAGGPGTPQLGQLPSRADAPAARTGTGAAASMTSGSRAERLGRSTPCPPASEPWATITSAPVATAATASATPLTWAITVEPAWWIGST